MTPDRAALDASGAAAPARAEAAAEPPAKTKKSAQRRLAILQRAAEVFDRQGYANTSLDDVAQAVGIKREALYYYYRNRSEILLAIIRPQAVALIDGLERVVAMDAPAAQKLELAIRNHLRRFDRYCLETTVSLRDGLFEANDDVRTEMSRIWKEYERMWTGIIQAGIDSGEFAPLGKPKMIAFGILGMCNWLARWYNPRKPVQIDELIDTYFRLVAKGLVLPDRGATAGGRRARRGHGNLRARKK